MPTVAEEWMKEGKLATLFRQIERRFCAVPEHAWARILAAPVGELDDWLDAFASASSLNDVFSNGAVH